MGIISGCRSTMWNPRPTRRCYARGRGRPEPLYALVKIRAAQLNGCAYCLDTRNRDARAGGEDQRRLDVLSGWREAPGQLSKQERTALVLTESVTLIGEGGDSDECTTVPQKHLGDAGMVHVLRPSPPSTCGTAWR
jgi:AhpD family alkylhydroperoxidase